MSALKGMENKHDLYRDKNCVKIFYESSTEHAMKINKFKKKKKGNY